MKKLFVLLAAVLVLLVVGFFVVTSSGFLKSVVLPRVGATLNARVDADEIALSPFSSLEIRKLVITPNGADRLAAIDLVRVRYSLTAILGGNIAIDEILVGSPNVTVVQKADGTSNLDPMLRQLSSSAGAAKPSAPAQPGKPVQLDLKSLKVENATLAYRSVAKDGATLAGEVADLNLTVANLKNGGNGHLELGAGLKFEQQTAGPAPAKNGLNGTLKGALDLGLTPELAPGAVSGKIEAQLRQATGAFKDFEGFVAVVSADAAPTELRQLALQFARGNTALGSVTARGPLDLAKKEARLQVDVNAIDRNVLNLFGTAMGLDFATTRFDSTNRIELTGAGQKLAISGAVTGARVSVKKGELTLPPIDARKTYDLAVDLAAQTATIKAFSLVASQAGREFARGTLAQPLQVSWAANAPALPDAAIRFVLTDLRLADWSALAGTPLQGALSAQADLGVRNAGKDLAVDATAALAGFSGTFGSNVVKNLGVNVSANVALASFADPARRGLKATATAKDLSGDAAVVHFDQYGLEAKADLALPEGQVTINDIAVRLKQGSQEGGAIGVKGRWNTARPGGDLTVSAKDVNEAGLRPFLQAALGEKQLRSVKLVADLTAKVDPAADSAVKLNGDIKDLVVRDPSGTVPESPLAIGVLLDASGSAQKLAVRQGEVRLTPTPRAKNLATLSGDLDFSKTNALKGAFKLACESLDVTPFFDLFAGGADASTTKPAPTPVPSTAPAGPATEPAAIPLPVDRLTFDATIGKLFLREIAAENFQAGVQITGSRIEVQPFQLTLNGAPIKAGLLLNLGVPGYEYDLKFSADKVPVKPMANSFAPSLRNRIEGSLIAGADVKGAGITGTSLQKTLSGGLQFAVTNANLKLAVGDQKPGVLSLLTTLLATTLNIRELKDQPIMDIVANAKLGAGKIEITEARARSASLEAGTVGSVPIAADILKSPLNFPVNVALNRELATRASLVSADTPTNAAYVMIPPVASLKGTLGAPVPEIDKVKAGLLAARGIAGLVGGQTGSAIGGVADLVGGVAKGGTNAVGNLIQGIGNLFGGNKDKGGDNATKAAPAATPAPTPAKSPATVSTNTPTAPKPTNAPAGTPTNKASPLGSALKSLLQKDSKK